MKCHKAVPKVPKIKEFCRFYIKNMTDGIRYHSTKDCGKINVA
jgi:hypothetical protein